MEICAGIIIWRKRVTGELEFFVGTPGGPQWLYRTMWNFPKGHIEEGETPFECAVREFYEETSVYPGSLCANDYIYEGLIKQRSSKSVHVYSKEWTDEELNENCKSNTFIEKDGNEYPEIGKYAWLTLDEIKKDGGVKSYYPLYETLIARQLKIQYDNKYDLLK